MFKVMLRVIEYNLCCTLTHAVLSHINALLNYPDGTGYNLAQLGEFEFPGAIRVWNLIGVACSLVFYPLFL